MTVGRLDDDRASALRAADLTYAEVGHTATGRAPSGFTWFEHSTTLRRTDLEAAADDLLRWQVQERSGLRVAATDSPLTVGTVVVLELGPRPVHLTIPCRVVAVVDEPDRRGFAYGTLPGHPECGEERFLLERGPEGRVVLTVSGFSRPSSFLSRLGGPISRWVQRTMTQRYLRALDRG